MRVRLSKGYDMRLRVLLAVVTLFCAATPRAGAQDQADPYSAAMQAYRAKDYAAYLENIRRVGQRLPYNVEVLEQVARAYALNNQPEQSLATLHTIARLGAAADLAHADFASLKGLAEMERLRAEFGRNNAPTSRSRVAFTLAEKDLIPEGIAYDQRTGDFYVGSIHNRKIVRIKRGGEVEDFVPSRRDGLQSVLGMKVDAARRLLWVCAASGAAGGGRAAKAAVYKYDLTGGKLVKKYESGGTARQHLFNDVAISRSGDVFVTDSLGGSVLAIRQASDALETLIGGQTFIYPNGIALSGDERFLFVADAGGIHRVELSSKAARPIAHAETVSLAGIDGLYWHEGALVGVQNTFTPERIVSIKLNSGLDRAERLTVLEANHAHFEIPTTGVIAGRDFYYIANSQLRALNEREEVTSPEKLKQTRILALPLGG
jgi:hypothetical protein